MNPSLRFVLILVGVLALVVLIAGDPDGSDPGPPLSPEGTGPSGAKAMTILLDELGADVDVDRGVPDADVETAVLLQDRLDDGRREALGRWVEDGGTLVVADPSSGLTPPVAEPVGSFAGFGDVDLDAGDCDMDALADVEHLDLGGGVLYESSAGSARCFDDGAGAFVVESAFGQGRVIAVGGPYPFTNEGLGRADAAVLVADLLAPDPEGTRVAFLDRADPVAGRPGGGDETLLDLVPDRVVLALIQLGLAFGAYVWFRARRAGRPVAEPLPTTLAGSELVAAVGQLLAAGAGPRAGRRSPAGRSASDLGSPPRPGSRCLAGRAPGRRRTGGGRSRPPAGPVGRPHGRRRRGPDHIGARHRRDSTGGPP